jgi:TonB family protein
MTCVRCHRSIDSWARICPFCNQNQTEPLPALQIVPEPVANYKPPEEIGLRKQLLIGGAGILLLIAAFGVGVVINSDDAPKQVPSMLEEQAAVHNSNAPRRADTPLIATNERGGFEQPITSAPATLAVGGTATDSTQRADATAVSATEYAELAKRAKAEKQRMAAAIDPRSIVASPYVAPPPRPRQPVNPPQMSSTEERAERTRPVLEYRPLPYISARGSARLTLLVGSDGRVREVGVDRPIAGNNAQLIAAVQRWRFKPATENGEPVSAPYSVEISFRRE